MQVPLQLPLGPRVRMSPFWDATVAAGLTAASVYNHMYMPVSYGDSMARLRSPDLTRASSHSS